MPTPPPDLLSSLPSVRELLEKPQVKVLFQRLGQTDVAVGVRQYLEQVGSDLQQRLNTGPMPSPSEMADRAARFVLSLESSQRRRCVINATGQLYGPNWAGLPLSKSAQQAILDVGSGYIPADRESAQQASNLLCQRTGAEAALCLHSYESALWVVIAAMASEGRRMVVAQSELGHTGTSSIREIAAATQAELVDVGSANVVRISDYEAAIDHQSAAIMQLQWDSFQTVGHVHRATSAKLISLARIRNIPFIAALDGAPLTASKHELDVGADLVVLRGEGQIGTVLCGLILGSRKWIDQIAAQPMSRAMSLDPMRSAGLLETLRPSASRAESEVPLQRLLETSSENLHHRAQNLVEQLIDSESLDSVEAIAIEATHSGHRTNSWAVAVTPADGQFEAISERLLAAQRPILHIQKVSQLLFDLAGVSPAEDQTIATALTGEPEA